MIKKIFLFSLLTISLSHSTLCDQNKKSAFSPYKPLLSFKEITPAPPFSQPHQTVAMEKPSIFENPSQQLLQSIPPKKMRFMEEIFNKYFLDAPPEEYAEIHKCLSQTPLLARESFKDFMASLKLYHPPFMVRLLLIFKMSNFFLEIRTNHKEQKQRSYKSLFNETICPCDYHEQWKYRTFCNQLSERIYSQPQALQKLQFIGRILDQSKPIS